MAQAEPRADADGPLAGGDEAPGHEVDGADVVGVEGVAQAQGVGKDGSGDEHGIEVQDYTDDDPYDDVDRYEEQDLPYYGRWEGTEGLRHRQVDVRPGQGEAGHDRPVFADSGPGYF